MKKGEAVKQLEPVDHDSRRQSMNMYRAAWGDLGDENTRTFFDLYPFACRESIRGGERFNQIARTLFMQLAKHAGNPKFRRDVAKALKICPPSKAKEHDPCFWEGLREWFVSPTWVFALRFFQRLKSNQLMAAIIAWAEKNPEFTLPELRKFIERETGQPVSDDALEYFNGIAKNYKIPSGFQTEFRLPELRDHIERETGQRVSDSTLARMCSIFEMKPSALRKSSPHNKDLEARVAIQRFVSRLGAGKRYTRRKLSEVAEKATGKPLSSSKLTRIMDERDPKRSRFDDARKMPGPRARKRSSSARRK